MKALRFHIEVTESFASVKEEKKWHRTLGNLKKKKMAGENGTGEEREKRLQKQKSRFLNKSLVRHTLGELWKVEAE